MKSGKPSAPKPVKELAKIAKNALSARSLAPAVVCKYSPREPAWKISARQIEVDLDSSFPGSWRVNMGWTMVPVPPRSDEMLVTESSIGLYGVEVPALGNTEEEVCLVRYDCSLIEAGSTLEPLGPHLNVHQPGDLRDSVHYKIPGLADHEWQVGEVLDFLLSDRLVKDLKGRLG
ncbi:MAG: hypothetical protein R2725_10650 [Solirubrobacterales bacterium]